MFKITQRNPELDCAHRGSVLYQHGYGFDAETSIALNNTLFGTEDKSMFLTIVDEGFDLWMGNYRGTKYSLGHTNPDPAYNTTYDFWNFSFEKMGLFDLPAFMDKIYEDNGGEKMHFVNTSLGTAVTHYALSKPDEENYFINRIQKVVQLAPCSGVV